MASMPIITSAVKERMLVAAIDFGTTYSGYAFSLRHEFDNDPLKVTANQWNVGSRSSVSLKTPTCILFSPNKEFDSFGYEAEDKYANLALDNQHHEWYYFRRFKMNLYENKSLNRNLMLQDDKGLYLPAMDVFSESIGFLVRHMIQSCEERDYGLSPEEIYWVLTVPAIWNDASKQFMREAANKAGIHNDNLSLALEPEAASLFCKYLPVERVSGGAGISCFCSGSKYLVVDAGGGTIDITAHEVESNCRIKELYKANGGPWGGTTIDDAFTDFLGKVTGEDVLQEFISRHRDDYIDLIREFEVKKRTITPEMDQKITFKLPISLHEIFRERRGQDFRQSQMANHPLNGKLTFAGDKLRVDSETVKNFFKETCSKIVDHLREIFRQPAVAEVNTILMVGGFSESSMLQYAIEQAFKDKKLILPNEAGLSVLKGAVIFGHTPRTIASRVCKYTYGVRTCRQFKEKRDPQSKMFFANQTIYCDDVFSRHVKVGQPVNIGESFEDKKYYPIYQDQVSVAFDIFTSNFEKPKYTDDVGCNKLGTVTVDYQDKELGFDRPVAVKMIYGQTELGVEAIEKKTGQKVNAHFDFLG